MAVHIGARAVRRQITLSPDVDARLQHIARQRGQSRSAIIAEAIRNLSEPSDQIERMLAFAGSIEGGGAVPLARMVDEVIYSGSSPPEPET